MNAQVKNADLSNAIPVTEWIIDSFPNPVELSGLMGSLVINPMTVDEALTNLGTLIDQALSLLDDDEDRGRKIDTEWAGIQNLNLASAILDGLHLSVLHMPPIALQSRTERASVVSSEAA